MSNPNDMVGLVLVEHDGKRSIISGEEAVRLGLDKRDLDLLESRADRRRVRRYTRDDRLRDAAAEILALLREAEKYCPVAFQDRIRALAGRLE